MANPSGERPLYDPVEALSKDVEEVRCGAASKAEDHVIVVETLPDKA